MVRSSAWWGLGWTYRDCHVGGDFLLAYKLDNTSKVEQVIFVRTDQHADLFE